jgi:hypothetical protein
MKHGPNALIDEKLPVVVVNTKEEGNPTSELRYEKTHSNMVEVKARDGIVISILTEGDQMSSKVSNHVIEIPPNVGPAWADPGGGAAAIVVVSHRRAARMRRRPAEEFGQVGHRGVGAAIMVRGF